MLAPLKDIWRAERERTVRAPITSLHYLGALATIFIAVEIFTGILLMIYYRPSAGAAYHSIAIIVDEVRLGWLIRALHRWCADLLIILTLLHLIRVYFARAYRPPGQLNWVVGVCLLILVLALGFTGTLLPWDQYAYWYIDSARATIAGVPVLGNLLLGVFWGGWEIGEEVLLRFYVFHVGVLPWMIVGLVCLHLWWVWRFGIQEPAVAPGSAAPPPTALFPDFVIDLFIIVLLVSGALLSVAVIFPPLLDQQADPLSPLAHTLPRWYFLAVRELLRGLPGGISTLSVLAFFVLLFLVPMLDRTGLQPRGRQLVHRALGLLVILAWAFLSARGFAR